MAGPSMAPAAVKPVIRSSVGGDVSEEIKKRRSQELIIALCGAIGSGTKELRTSLESYLFKNGYEVETIKISDIIFRLRKDPGLSSKKRFERYRDLQTAGNEIREKLGNNKLAAEAIGEVISKRDKHLPKVAKEEGKEPDDKNTKKVAYVVDQLKHPDEVNLFRTVYRQNFYLIGLISTEKERKTNLLEQSIDIDNADILIHRDRKEDEPFGQQVEKTFHLADYFIRNRQNSTHMNDSVERVIKLIHGVNGVTPTHDEVGLYEAFSASLKSACLSRQVGAAIMNENGDILSTGCNDVPAYGGGLYTADDGKNDRRCIFKGEKCYNDLHKKKLQDQFESILEQQIQEIKNDPNFIKLVDQKDPQKNLELLSAEILKKKVKVAEDLFKQSKAKDLIEYSRAIHAEMDAMIQLARSEGQSTVGTTLYCTTYPCHSCARHIVAAGIKKVIYIEPYEKSLALELHDDAITDTQEKNKVIFEPFEGVSPRRYSKFFQASKRKDKGGKAIISQPRDSHHIDPQFLDSYYDYERRVALRSSEQENPFEKK